jgi:SGNH domain (fused to AT3 domains)
MTRQGDIPPHQGEVTRRQARRHTAPMPRAVILTAVAALAVGAVASADGAQPTKPRCYGAASRDFKTPCHNSRLRLMVKPTPAAALLAPNGFCAPDKQDPLVCGSGALPPQATQTVALVGDSHAKHWRGALNVVAKTRGWRLKSLTLTGCPLSAAPRNLPEPAKSECAKWNQDVQAWFQAHPEVSTVFVSELAGGTGAVVPSGQSKYKTEVAGYVNAWNALPPTVKHIVVIRDTPKQLDTTPACVESAIRKKKNAGLTCSIPRAKTLDRDPAVDAAAQIGPQRAQVADLTGYMCGKTLCYPVVGGALVFKDKTHITLAFAETLGPYLDRRLTHLMLSWR